MRNTSASATQAKNAAGRRKTTKETGLTRNRTARPKRLLNKLAMLFELQGTPAASRQGRQRSHGAAARAAGLSAPWRTAGQPSSV